MRMKTVVGGGFFVLAGALVLALASCGGGGGGSSTTESDVVNSTVDWITVEANTIGLSFHVPPEFSAKEGDGFVAVGVPSNDALPALFSITEVVLPEGFPDQVEGDALMAIANIQLESEDFIYTSEHDGGLEVTARTFAGNHFYYYDTVSNRAVEFMSGEDDYFSTQDFLSILKSLEF